MSSSTEIMISCPKCQKAHPFVIWRSINTVLNPVMKEAVKNRSAFLFECPSCGERTYVDYGFLYHQMEDRIMICYANSDENAEEMYKLLTDDDPAGMLHEMKEKDYLIRIVRTQNELREKIAIFDEGFDDRIIEIFKLFVLAAFQENNPDSKAIEILYFRDDNKNYVQIFADGSPRGVIEFPAGLYEELCQKYSGIIPDIRKDEPYIDRQWALETIGLT